MKVRKIAPGQICLKAVFIWIGHDRLRGQAFQGLLSTGGLQGAAGIRVQPRGPGPVTEAGSRRV